MVALAKGRLMPQTRARSFFLTPSFAAFLGVLLFATPIVAQLTFDEIALEFTEGLGFLDAGIAPAIDENGRVIFGGSDPFGNQKLFVGDGTSGLTANSIVSFYGSITSVQLNADDHVAWTGLRTAGGFTYRGAYRSNVAGSFAQIMREGSTGFPDPLNPPVNSRVALSPNGTVAYSTIVNGDGAIYRHGIEGASTVLREGTGFFYNNQRLDVNDAGEVVIQMEYFDPTRGLARGLPIFDAFNQSTSEINTAVEKMDVGTRVQPSINASGEVAFSLNSTSTMTFYDPPDDAMGTVVAVVTLTPGVYIVTPTAFGEPPIYTQIVDTSTGFDSFGSEVQLNENGVVVFRGIKTSGGSGLYFGPDPVADKILEPGDVMDGRLFSIVIMGELNDSNQLSMITSDFYSTDRQVWRVNNVPEPGLIPLLFSGLVGFTFLFRLRCSG